MYLQKLAAGTVPMYLSHLDMSQARCLDSDSFDIHFAYSVANTGFAAEIQFANNRSVDSEIAKTAA